VTILETEKIDIVATRPGSAVVKLVIADHLGWEDLDGHLRLLQDKLNAYIDFVEAGQVHALEHPPIPAEPAFSIELTVPSRPPDAAQGFLARAQEFLAERGIGFTIQLRPLPPNESLQLTEPRSSPRDP
jgi:hypothetical protein